MKLSVTLTTNEGTRSTVKSWSPSSPFMTRLRPTPTLVMQTAGTVCLHCLIKINGWVCLPDNDVRDARLSSVTSELAKRPPANRNRNLARPLENRHETENDDCTTRTKALQLFRIQSTYCCLPGCPFVMHMYILCTTIINIILFHSEHTCRVCLTH